MPRKMFNTESLQLVLLDGKHLLWRLLIWGYDLLCIKSRIRVN